MTGAIDYHNGHLVPRSSESFYFVVDYQVPELVNHGIRSFEDGLGRRRIFLDLDVYDNNLVQALQIFSVHHGRDGLAAEILTNYPVPVRGSVPGEVTRVALDITEMYYTLYNQPAQYARTIGVWIADHALNQSMWIIPMNHNHVDNIEVGAAGDNGVIEMEPNQLIDLNLNLQNRVPVRATNDAGEYIPLYEGDVRQRYPDGSPRYVMGTPALVPAVGASVLDLSFGIYMPGTDNPQPHNNPFISIHNGQVFAHRVGSVDVVVSAHTGIGERRFSVVVGGEARGLVNATMTRIGSYIDHNAGDTRRIIRDNRPHGDSLILENGADITLQLQMFPWNTTVPLGRDYVTWHSSDPTVLYIDSYGRARALRPSPFVYVRATVRNHGTASNVMTTLPIAIRNEYEVTAMSMHRYSGPGFTSLTADVAAGATVAAGNGCVPIRTTLSTGSLKTLSLSTRLKITSEPRKITFSTVRLAPKMPSCATLTRPTNNSSVYSNISSYAISKFVSTIVS